MGMLMNRHRKKQSDEDKKKYEQALEAKKGKKPKKAEKAKEKVVAKDGADIKAES